MNLLWYYFILLAAVVLLGGEFSFQKQYQKTAGASSASGLFYSAAVGLFTAVIFYFLNCFWDESAGSFTAQPDFGIAHLHLTPFALLTASGFVLCLFLYRILGFNMMKRGSMATYTLFLMTGGMTLPFLYGIIFGDEFTSLGTGSAVARIVGLAVILLGVVLANRPEGQEKANRAVILLGVFAFLLNGGTSVFSNIHQKAAPEQRTTVIAFVALEGLLAFLYCSIALLVLWLRDRNALRTIPVKKTAPTLLFATLASSISFLGQLIGAAHLPASVNYPIITGGAIIMTALAGRIFFKERIRRATVIGIVLCFAGTCLFLV